MRRTCCVLAIMCTSCAYVAQIKVIPVYEVKQGKTPWCWAAATAVAIEHVTGKRLQACQVVNSYHNQAYQCCKHNKQCMHGVSPVHLYATMLRLKLPAHITFHKPTFHEIKTYLWENKIILYGVKVREKKKVIEEHVSVIHGYYSPEKTLFVMDSVAGAMLIKYKDLEKTLGDFHWAIVIGD